ncbi:glycerol-3-phosphate acyltransferase 1, mitochondrial-like isoform X2 [Varroa destructor]|uniref:Phospholipid/glycerol acyltransferase domain-containing protein n=1 Tax=Varroa destructor TaxID=109461 RepID=A0A7M7K3W5_VARDE|nr:glycerol-3-phosphate acyltransferase 1, mitochondrial-like isoform X2 [Varroa destructor]
MGSSDSNDNNGGVPMQGGTAQTLVRRLQISPPGEFFIAGNSPVNRTPTSDFVQAVKTVRISDVKIGLVPQIHDVENLNIPILRKLTTLSRSPEALSATEERQCGLKKISSYDSYRPAVANAETEDLVDLLVRPDAAHAGQHLSWYLMPLVPLHYLGEWIKHIMWLSARAFPWKYPRVTPNKIINSNTEAAERRDPDALIGNLTEVVSKDARHLHVRRACQILDMIAARTSVIILRIASIVVDRIFQSCLSGIYVRRDLVDELRTLSLANPGVPVVYLPLHRSHLDYILLTYILWLHDMRLPQVAAGDNIALPVFNFLLRGLGAFFIRRKIDQGEESGTISQSGALKKDYIYRGVLQEYMCELLTMGHSMEFYMEGGRSRNGRTLPAKGGLLSVLLHAYQSRAVTDVIIVPGGVTYDKPFDGSFAEEQRGIPKTKETFSGAIRSIWGVMCSQFGSVRLELGKPFTLKGFLEENVERFDLHKEFDFSGSHVDNNSVDETPHRTQSSASLVNSASESQHKINKLTHCLATQVLCASTSARALSGPSLVAFLMMTRFRMGCQEFELVSALHDLCTLLRSSPKLRSLTFTDLSTTNLSHIIRYTEWLFPDLVTIRTPATVNANAGNKKTSPYSEADFLCKGSPTESFVGAHTDSINAAFDLQYIANPVAEALIGEAILAAALLAVKAEQHQASPTYSVRRGSCASEITVKAYVEEDEIDGSQICFVTWSSVERVVAELCDILEMEFVYLQEPRETLKTMENAKKVLVKEGLLLAGDENRLPSIRCDLESLQRLADLRSGIVHLIEGYAIVALLLHGSRSNSFRLCDRCLVNECLRNALSNCQKGLVEYPEGCSKDIIQNAVKLFIRWGVLVPADSPAPALNHNDLVEAKRRRHFHLGEESSVDDYDPKLLLKEQQGKSVAELCFSVKCASSRMDGTHSCALKISEDWMDKLPGIVAKLQRFQTPFECQ